MDNAAAGDCGLGAVPPARSKFDIDIIITSNQSQLHAHGVGNQLPINTTLCPQHPITTSTPWLLSALYPSSAFRQFELETRSLIVTKKAGDVASVATGGNYPHKAASRRIAVSATAAISSLT